MSTIFSMVEREKGQKLVMLVLQWHIVVIFLTRQVMGDYKIKVLHKWNLSKYDGGEWKSNVELWENEYNASQDGYESDSSGHKACALIVGCDDENLTYNQSKARRNKKWNEEEKGLQAKYDLKFYEE